MSRFEYQSDADVIVAYKCDQTSEISDQAQCNDGLERSEWQKGYFNPRFGYVSLRKPRKLRPKKLLRRLSDSVSQAARRLSSIMTGERESRNPSLVHINGDKYVALQDSDGGYMVNGVSQEGFEEIGSVDGCDCKQEKIETCQKDSPNVVHRVAKSSVNIMSQLRRASIMSTTTQKFISILQSRRSSYERDGVYQQPSKQTEYLSVDNSPNQKKQDPIYEEHYGRVRKYSDDKNVKWQFESAGGPSYLVSQLRSVFLPINYPSSVHPCYLKFHAWQALETYVAAVVGVLCSQAMLESLGISKAASTAGAVAIQWVLKDGIAEMGKLLFIKRYARSFDSHPRTWKAIGEVLTTLGSGLQLCTILVPSNYFLLLAASGNILKSVSWAVWGVTHMWFIRNFALSNNVGDLSAKAEAQSALALVSGWMSGVVLLSYSHSPATLFLTYLLLAPVHGLATYKELKNAEIGSMNNAKALVLCRGFVHNNGTDVYQVGDAQIEKWIGILGESLRKKPKRSLENGKLKQQHQIDDAFDRLPDVRMGSTIESSFDALQDARTVAETIRDENYLLGVRTLMRSDGSRQRTIHIVLHKEAEGRDSLKALLNAVKLDQMLDLRTLQKEDELCHNKKMMSIFKDSHQWTLDHFASFIAKLDNHDWQTESVLFSDAGFRAQWKKLPKNDVIDLEIPPQSTSASDPKSQQ
ncbi:hypothetical protein MP228_008971 [Amoeboaphelidium protococcarum]|nr:hypothetical protein MP228_008971 [Amoeboaphelidium protococcarum]